MSTGSDGCAHPAHHRTDPLGEAIAAQEAALAHSLPDRDGRSDPQTAAALYELMDGQTYGVELANLDAAERRLNDQAAGRADGDTNGRSVH